MEFQAFILSLLLSVPAAADDDGLVVSGEPEFSQPTEQSQPVSGGEPAPIQTGEDWRPPPGYDTPAKKAPPPRFTLEEKERTRRYLNSLCTLEPVAAEESRRAQVRGTRVSVVAARNKQGSLRLLLENFVDSFREEDECVARRSRYPAACREPGSLKKWQGSHAAWKIWKDSPRGADLLSSQREQRERTLKALQTEFYELRDASQLRGEKASLAQAERVLLALRNESSCGTRAIETAQR